MHKSLFAVILILAGVVATMAVQAAASFFPGGVDISRYVVFPHFDEKPTEHEANVFDSTLAEAGIKGCGNVFGMLGDVVTQGALYTASTIWADNGRFISSNLGMDFPTDSGVSKAAGVVFAASGRDGSCSGAFVRVFPVPMDCETFRAANLAGAERSADLRGVPVYSMANGWDAMLLPTPGVCVVVATARATRG